MPIQFDLIMYLVFLVIFISAIYLYKQNKWFNDNCPLSFNGFINSKNIQMENIKQHPNVEVIKESDLLFSYNIKINKDTGIWLFTYDFYKQWDGIKLSGNKVEFFHNNNNKPKIARYYGSYDSE